MRSAVSRPDARIIVLTMYEGEEHIHRAMSAGAATYLLKDTLSADLVRVIRQVHSGSRPCRRTSRRPCRPGPATRR